MNDAQLTASTVEAKARPIYVLTARMESEEGKRLMQAAWSLPPIDGKRLSLNKWAVGALLDEAEKQLAPAPIVEAKLKRLLERGLTESQATDCLKICCPSLIVAKLRHDREAQRAP